MILLLRLLILLKRYIKHSRQCFIRYLKTSKFVENTPLRVVSSTLFSMFGYPDETLSLVFDILLPYFRHEPKIDISGLYNSHTFVIYIRLLWMAEMLCKLPEETAMKILLLSIYLTRLIGFHCHKHLRMTFNLPMLSMHAELNVNSKQNIQCKPMQSEKHFLFQTKIAQKSYPLGQHLPK